MAGGFKLPSIKKGIKDWEALEQRVANIFTYAVGCSSAEKQIAGGFEVDCLAKDEQRTYVIECKTKDELSQTNQKLKDYILTFAGKKTSIARWLNSTDGSKEIIFILCAEGFDLTDQHKKLAIDNHIYLWQGSFLRNLENLYSAIGSRSKQYVLQSLEVEDRIVTKDNQYEQFQIPALAYEAVINGEKQRIYNMFMSADLLLDLGFVYHISAGEESAYQRILKTSRLRGIGEFIDDENTFTSSVVVILNDETRFKGLGREEEHEYKTGFLYLPKRRSSVRIIDGQHRLYAYEWAHKDHLKDKIPVIALQKISAGDQAKVFLDINTHQNPVKKDDLNLIMARTDPLGTGFVPNVVLNANENGVLKNRIKTPIENSPKSRLSKINFANAVKGITDRHIFTVSNPLIYGNVAIPTEEIVSESAKVLNDFYQQVIDIAEATDQKWVNEFIFTNNGFNILTYLIAELGKFDDHYKKGWSNTQISMGLTDYFRRNVDRIDDIRGRSSEGGRRDAAKELIYTISKFESGFGAKLLRGYKPKTDTIHETKGSYLEAISDIENLLKKAIKSRLSERLGVNWWLQCVPDSVRNRIVMELANEKDAYFQHKPSKQEDYLTFNDMGLIIERHWTHFKDIFKDKGQVLGALSDIKYIRNPLSHGKELADLSDESKSHFNHAIRELGKRLASYREED